jgi:hypothetical protein
MTEFLTMIRIQPLRIQPLSRRVGYSALFALSLVVTGQRVAIAQQFAPEVRPSELQLINPQQRLPAYVQDAEQSLTTQWLNS